MAEELLTKIWGEIMALKTIIEERGKAHEERCEGQRRGIMEISDKVDWITERVRLIEDKDAAKGHEAQGVKKAVDKAQFIGKTGFAVLAAIFAALGWAWTYIQNNIELIKNLGGGL